MDNELPFLEISTLIVRMRVDGVSLPTKKSYKPMKVTILIKNLKYIEKTYSLSPELLPCWSPYRTYEVEFNMKRDPICSKMKVIVRTTRKEQDFLQMSSLLDASRWPRTDLTKIHPINVLSF